MNLVGGLGCAIPVTRFFSRANTQPRSAYRYFTILIGIYVIECIAVVIGMGIPVFNVGLAFIWGIILGIWLQARMPKHEVLKTTFFLSLYSSMPAASFIVVPVLALVSGWHILNSKEGVQFGIPEFLNLPWPMNTIVGFYGVLVIAAVTFKTIITTGEVSLLLRLRHRRV